MPPEIEAVGQGTDCTTSTPKRSHKGTASKKIKVVKTVNTSRVPDLSVAGPSPHRSLTPVASLLVASLASFRLQLYSLDELCLFLHDGRLDTFQGQFPSLLSSLDLNAAFETLEIPLQDWKGRILVDGGTELWRMNAFFVAMQSSIGSNGLSWSRRKLKKIHCLPTGAWCDAIQATISARIKQGHHKRRKILRKMRTTKLHKLCNLTSWLATDRSADNSYTDLEKQQHLEEWEVLDHEITRSDDLFKCSTKGDGGLVCEIIQLIGNCEGLGFAGWDEMIAMLEGGFDYRTGQGNYATGYAEAVRSEGPVVHDDWELVC